MESTLAVANAKSVYDFLIFEEVIGASQVTNTGEKFLLIRRRGVVAVDKNFEFTGKLRNEI